MDAVFAYHIGENTKVIKIYVIFLCILLNVPIMENGLKYIL